MRATLLVLALMAGCCRCEPPQAVAAPLTRLELHPAELRIPLGEDRTVHVEVFSRDTPLVPVQIETWISRGGDVVELRRYAAPFITVRGLRVGEAELAVTVGDKLSQRVPVVVTGATEGG